MVKNFDKNGKEIKDLSKITIKRADFEVLYKLLEAMPCKREEVSREKIS